LTVSGTSEFNNTVSVDADFRVRTSGGVNKFTVDDATGNTTISGDTSISGNTSIVGTLSVDGNTTIGNNASGDLLVLNCAINSTIRPSNTLANLDIGSFGQKFRDGHFSGTLYATAISGITSISANVTGNLTGNASSASQLYVTDNANNTDYKILFATAGGTGGNKDVYTDANSLYFNPNTNTLGVSNIACSNVGNGSTTFDGNLTGTAAKSDKVKVTEDAGSSNTYYVYFGEGGGGGNQRDVKTDTNVFAYQPSSNKLSVGEVACSSIGTAGNTTFGTASQNAYGTRVVSTNNPSGGSDGDIWYKY
jgi:hypothetical protein